MYIYIYTYTHKHIRVPRSRKCEMITQAMYIACEATPICSLGANDWCYIYIYIHVYVYLYKVV